MVFICVVEQVECCVKVEAEHRVGMEARQVERLVELLKNKGSAAYMFFT